MIRDQMEKIYSETPPGDIPWNIESPPKSLVELVESGQVQPCKTIDMGCGAGNYAVYLASVVNEEGTEAAAATAVTMAAWSSRPHRPPPIPVFRADHPFVFMIRHRESGSILFIGRLVDPGD